MRNFKKVKKEKMELDEAMDEQIEVTFVSETGEAPFSSFAVPKNVTPEKLKLLLQAFHKTQPKDKAKSEDDDEDAFEDVPYLFFINEHEIKTTVADCIKHQIVNTEKSVPIVFQPQAVFKVRPVARCTSSMPGHEEPVIVASFSASGRFLASGSGDTKVRFWDLNTETPQHACQGHRQWVLALAWAPNDLKVASGDKSGTVIVWDPITGKQIGPTMAGHKAFITALAWEPLHINGMLLFCSRFIK